MRRALTAILGWWLLRKLPPDLGPGDVCVVMSGDGDYQIAKVLATDQSIVHLRTYKNRFSSPPSRVDTAELSLGEFGDKDGFGIGHLPLSRSTFASWLPVRIQREPVTGEEMEGCRIWEEPKGEIWT